MEVFEFEDRGNHEMIYCKKRNLTVLVIHKKDIPQDLPEHFLIVFGTYLEAAKRQKFGLPDITTTAFCITEPDVIEYEAPLIHVLICNAIIEWCDTHVGEQFDKLEYTPNYIEKYIKTMPTDISNVSPQLRAYMTGVGLKNSMDFYEWKEQYWDNKID